MHSEHLVQTYTYFKLYVNHLLLTIYYSSTFAKPVIIIISPQVLVTLSFIFLVIFKINMIYTNYWAFIQILQPAIVLFYKFHSKSLDSLSRKVFPEAKPRGGHWNLCLYIKQQVKENIRWYMYNKVYIIMERF